MDSYTLGVKTWLDQRYRYCDSDGIYVAHQPIYGFGKGHCEPSCQSRYTITFMILRALARLPAASILDVGGAEGYKAWLARKFLGLEARSADLSGEACRRAEQIFGIRSDEVDSHNLPYRDGEFDITLSSESIEHVSDYRSAVDELIRVAAKAVVITVPRENPEVVRRNIENKEIHGHIHAFNTRSFDYLKEQGIQVTVDRILHPMTLLMTPIIDGKPKSSGRYARILYTIVNLGVRAFSGLTGIRTSSLLLTLDTHLCRWTGLHHGLVFTLLKPGTSLKEPAQRIKAIDVLKVAVPFHYPENPAFSYREIVEDEAPKTG